MSMGLVNECLHEYERLESLRFWELLNIAPITLLI